MNKIFLDGYNKAIRDVVQHLTDKKKENKEPIKYDNDDSEWREWVGRKGLFDDLINEIKIMEGE